MLSIASWRSGAAKEQEAEKVEPVVRRAAPKPEAPGPIVISPATPAVEGDHRGAPRQPASAVPSISGLTLSPYGAEATLVNISATGLLAECGVPLKIGNFVKVVFEGARAPRPVEGRVVRISVASMASSGVRYNVGVAFKVPIDLEGEAAPQNRADGSPAGVAAADQPQPSGPRQPLVRLSERRRPASPIPSAIPRCLARPHPCTPPHCCCRSAPPSERGGIASCDTHGTNAGTPPPNAGCAGPTATATASSLRAAAAPLNTPRVGGTSA